LIQYAVACAAEHGDWKSRSLRPIHILKYVYLADLGFAEKHGGVTFTGAPWEFHYFGPWSALVQGRIALALASPAFEERHFETDHGESVAYHAQGREIREQLDRQIPLAASRPLQRALKEFGTATNDLLHFVYRTPPMLHAAPREALDFTTVVPRDINHAELPGETPPLTEKQRKRRAERLREIRAKAAELRSNPQPSGRVVVRPEYSPEVLDALLQVMESSQDEPSHSGTLHFMDEVWQSGGRTDDGVP
jgi:hypothetical protein